MKPFELRIITPKRKVMEDVAVSVTAPSSQGEITILYNHLPLFALLREGIVTVRKDERDQTLLSIGGGYIETTGKVVNLLVSRAYEQDELDEELVRKAKEEAEQLVRKSKSEEERRRATALLRRSLIDLKVIRRRRKKRPQIETD